MSRFGQQLTPNDAPALPLWIDGHAYLMMAEQFLDVQDASGKVLRRVPLYGEEAVAIAVGSTAKAVGAWQAHPEPAVCFAELQALLERYGAHLAKLLVAEAGWSAEAADAEVARGVAAVAGQPAKPHVSGSKRVAAALADAQAPLAGPLGCAAAALAAGWGIVLKPSPKVPSALFACAELFTRAGFPDGAVNCVHGDEKAVRALSAHAAVGAVAFCGEEVLAARVGEIVRSDGKAFAGGEPGDALLAAWQRCLGGDQ